ITIQSGNADALTDRIQEMYPSVIVSNLAEQARGERAMLIVISIFLYGFITVITLIGVTNIFNTITSNMELRRREFAMLKSVGMTTGEFNRMIRLETLFYSVKAFLYGIAMSLVGTVLLCRAFSLKLETGMYLPIVPTIISGVFVFLFVFAIMKYSMGKINRQNIIETIRSENV
ncbi:MAG: ABC transporter permease, partial [Agathobacter sp.]|nr:ABC transporter permease [Agathobacter sp.]